MAITEAAKEAVYLRNLLNEITEELCCISLHNDNQSAQKLSSNLIFHKWSKHIDVRYHFIGEILANKFVQLKYMGTDEMMADIMIKPLCSVKHGKFMKQLGIRRVTL